MPERMAGGGVARLILTAYETTELDELEESVVGAMAETVPVRSALIASTVTSAAWPTWIFATSLSTTSAVTWYALDAIVIATPDGAIEPFWMFTAVTMPAAGAMSSWRAPVAWRSRR